MSTNIKNKPVPNTPHIWTLLHGKGITLYGISKRHGIYTTLLSNFLNDSGYVSVGTAERILSAFSAELGVPVNELVLND